MNFYGVIVKIKCAKTYFQFSTLVQNLPDRCPESQIGMTWSKTNNFQKVKNTNLFLKQQRRGCQSFMVSMSKLNVLTPILNVQLWSKICLTGAQKPECACLGQKQLFFLYLKLQMHHETCKADDVEISRSQWKN